MESVFERVRSAVATLEAVVADLEPGTLDASGAEKLVGLFTRCERLSVAGRGLAARRVESALSWRREGHRSAAHWLASTTGVSVGAATRSLQTARELETLPATSAAFRSGELSEAQASEIAATAALDPASESRLLDSARAAVSFKGLRDQCREASVRAADDVAAARRLHETRAVHTWTERDGAWRMDVRLAPDDGAFVAKALEDWTSKIFRARHAAGQMEPRPAYVADAVVALVKQGPCKPIEVRLEASHGALERGYVEPGERCELAGVGPVPVTMARGLLDDARITVLSREGTDITRVSSPRRTIPAKLRRGLEAAYPVCGVDGCANDQRLEIDHIIPIRNRPAGRRFASRGVRREMSSKSSRGSLIPAARHGDEVDDRVGGAPDRHVRHDGVVEGLHREELRWPQVRPYILHDLPAALRRHAPVRRVAGGDARCARQREPERLGDRRHRGGGSHGHAVSVRTGDAIFDLAPVLLGDVPRASPPSISRHRSRSRASGRATCRAASGRPARR